MKLEACVLRYGGGSVGSGVEGAVEGRQGSFMEAPDTEALRRDLLTGHLLALATEDGLPRHALPALAASLQVTPPPCATLFCWAAIAGSSYWTVIHDTLIYVKIL